MFTHPVDEGGRIWVFGYINEDAEDVTLNLHVWDGPVAVLEKEEECCQ